MTENTPASEPVLRDSQTVQYFDNYVPDYSDKQSKHVDAVIENFIRPFAGQNSSLVEIGGGTGSLLRLLLDKTDLKDLCAIDVSKNSLRICKQRSGCETYVGSICDAEFVRQLPRQFDFATVSFLLHHLIGKSRSQSLIFARQAIENSLKLVRPGGYLIVFEPLFGPESAMTRVFYAKKFTTRFISKRLPLFGRANNLGEPVVSYLTEEQMLAILESNADCELCAAYADEAQPTRLMQWAGIRRWADGCFVVRKLDAQCAAERKMVA